MSGRSARVKGGQRVLEGKKGSLKSVVLAVQKNKKSQKKKYNNNKQKKKQLTYDSVLILSINKHKSIVFFLVSSISAKNHDNNLGMYFC